MKMKTTKALYDSSMWITPLEIRSMDNLQDGGFHHIARIQQKDGNYISFIDGVAQEESMTKNGDGITLGV